MKCLNQIMLLILSALLMLPELCGAVISTNAQEENLNEEDIKHLVVMVNSKIPGTDIDRIGAGIIFGVGADSLYIVTANHVVRQGETAAEDVEVRFRWRQDQPVKANLLRHADPSMDLAVLRVVGLNQIGTRVDALPFERVHNPNSLKRGDGIYLLGYPLQKAWRLNATPEKFAEKNRDSIEFESNFLARGHSGGALLCEEFDLAGMLKSENPPYGEAVRIDKIMQRLREWGYPVNLGRQMMPTKFSSVSAGQFRTCGLSNTGTAYCWGKSGHLQTLLIAR